MTMQRILHFVLFAAVVTVVMLLSYVFRVILAPFLIAYVLQYMLRPFVLVLSTHGMKHSTAVLVVFFSTFAMIALAFFFIVPAIAVELATVQDNIEGYADILTVKYQELQDALHDNFGMFGTFMGDRSIGDEMTSYLNHTLTSLIQGLTKSVFNVLGLFLNLSVIPFATFFFLYDNQRIKMKLVSMVPNRYFEITLNMLYRLNLQVGFILRGMLTSVVIISLIATAGLFIIGLDYPILVGVFSGLANLIPYFGPIAGACAACLVALMTGKTVMFFVSIVIVFLVTNILDNVLVQPIVLSKAANLHPLLIIFLVLAGSNIGGIMGMLLAVPLASLLQIIVSILATEIRRPVRPPFSAFIARKP